ncbi:FMN-dependent NADH-azoreductase [Nocardioides sp.]|uniref:FMN-dependent NADH-azoreductase n=1 Tax=Nocardioides sp. TaxID=35761 RepID=UPI003564C76A
MTRLLYVTSSPQAPTVSYSRRVSDAFVAAYQRHHPDDEIDCLDLWQEHLPEFGPVASAWKTKAMLGRPPSLAEEAEHQVVELSIRRFLAADKYVFSVPMWNFGIPYKLKHYFDVIVQPRHTFGLDPERGMVGLVPSTRPVQLILARAGVYAPDSGAEAMDHQVPYLRMILGFMGLNDVRIQIVEGTGAGPKAAEPMICAAMERAAEAGANF